MNLEHDTTARRWSSRTLTTLGFAYIFLVMTSYYVLKPVRESFFLERGYRNVPWVHLLVLGVTFCSLLIYTRIARLLGPARLVNVTNAFFLCCILGFWIVLTKYGDVGNLRAATAWVYYCWVSVFAVFSVTLFWSVIHSAFTPGAAAQSYGHIGAGATCGAMTGGALTKFLGEPLGTEHLLLVAFFVLAPCFALGSALTHLVSSFNADATATVSSRGTAPRPRTSTIQLFRQSSYLSVLATIVFLWVFIMVLDEYRGHKIIQLEIPETDRRTAFFGSIYFYANMIGLFLSLVVTGPILSRWGPRPALLMFAGLIIATAFGFLLAPGLPVVGVSLIALQAFGYSIGQWSRELLYTKSTTAEKFLAKGFIDTFMFRAGAGAASLALIVAASIGPGEDGLLANAVTQLSLITIPLGLTMASLMWWISGRFQRESLPGAPDASACDAQA